MQVKKNIIENRIAMNSFVSFVEIIIVMSRHPTLVEDNDIIFNNVLNIILYSIIYYFSNCFRLVIIIFIQIATQLRFCIFFIIFENCFLLRGEIDYKIVLWSFNTFREYMNSSGNSFFSSIIIIRMETVFNKKHVKNVLLKGKFLKYHISMYIKTSPSSNWKCFSKRSFEFKTSNEI